ncbi:Zinc finger BED domain-containing protein 1 [Merluccius polli]|uniref:Zinc finger BED domain-containing protein 1 n=1 Tax=Merluccius polli TaxID=89951 RepID=A0AA47MN19_MERPO|nr:Zinc finger BED domain-containing protein 1 [Merluccius polli]
MNLKVRDAHALKDSKAGLLDVERQAQLCICFAIYPTHLQTDRYFTNDNLTHAKDALTQQVEKMEVRRAASEVSEAEPVKRAPCINTASSSLGSVFDEILQESETEPMSVSTSSAFGQVQSYLAEQAIPQSDNPLQYWRAHATQFPSLAATATTFLCAPCTSVDSEGLFTAVSNVIEEKRNRLSANKAEMWIFLKKNFHREEKLL